MIRTTPGPALHRLLDETAQLPPEYAAGLSNHLPMALAALDGLGADEARLRHFAAGYVAKLDLSADAARPAAAAVDAVDGWQRLRGRIDAYDVLRATFMAAVASEGGDAVLGRAVPSLIAGAGAAAFHGPIRLAHAVESAHDGELAAALAYWAARWMPLPPPAPPGQGGRSRIDGVAAWLDAIDDHLLSEALAGSSAPLIALRMQDAARRATYDELAGRLGPAGRAPADLLHELAVTAASRYAATRNFTVLHLATGARAARVLSPWLPTSADALAPLWHAVAAASIASGAASAPRLTAAVDAAGWPEVVAAALATDDEHVIKLVHAMASQNDAAPHPAWLQAAAVAVGPLSGPRPAQ